MSEIYNGLRNEAKSIGEKNDCGVKALAVITGLPYAECHKALKMFGRRDGKATFGYQMMKAINHLGFETRVVDCPYRGLRSLGRNMPSKGAFLLSVTNHYAGAKDGQIHDWSAGRCLRIDAVYQIVKRGSDEPVFKFEEEKATGRTRSTRVLYRLVHKERGIVAEYKRFPTKVKKVIDSKGIIVVNGIRRLASDYRLETV